MLRPPVNSRLAIMGVYTAGGEPQKQMIILLSPPPPPSQALTTIYITKTKFQVFMKGAGELHSQQLWSDISEIKSPLNIFTLARNNSHYPRCVVHYLALRLDSGPTPHSPVRHQKHFNHHEIVSNVSNLKFYLAASLYIF